MEIITKSKERLKVIDIRYENTSDTQFEHFEPTYICVQGKYQRYIPMKCVVAIIDNNGDKFVRSED